MSEPTLRTDDARLAHRNRARLAVAASPVAAMAVALVYGVLGGAELASAAIPVLAVLSVASIWSALKRNAAPRLEDGVLEIGATGEVRFGGRVLAAPGDLEGGFVVPSEDGPRVLLRRRGLRLPVVLAVRDVEAGRTILRALGLDASQAVAEARAMSPVYASQLGLAAIALGVPLAFFGAMQALFHFVRPGLSGVIGLGVAFVALSALVAASVAPRRVTVGVDGVLVRWVFGRRFIPFAALRAVRAFEGPTPNDLVGVELEVEGEGRVRLPVGRRLELQDAALLAERIEQARQTFASRRAGNVAHALGRGAASPAQWLARLRTLAAGANADMRTAPIEELELVRVLEDASLGDSDRVGAALALAVDATPERRERVRVVARTVASPRLRVALEAVASAESDHALVTALAEVQADEEDQALARRA